MKRILGITTLVLVVVVSACRADSSPNISSVELTDFGLLDAKVEETIDLSSTATEKTNLVSETVFKTETNRVPARIGQFFGIEFFVHGEPKDEKTEIIFQVNHPEMNGRRASSAKAVVTIGKKNVLSYRFDVEAELVEGLWTFQLVHLEEKRLLLEKEFEVYKP